MAEALAMGPPLEVVSGSPLEVVVGLSSVETARVERELGLGEG